MVRGLIVTLLIAVLVNFVFTTWAKVSPMKAESAPEGRDIAWRLAGPGGGGWIQAIAGDQHDPNIIYVGCDVGGFYVSFDGGKKFEIRNNGLRNYFVEAIAVHPKNPKVILAGTEGGIFRTTDRGKTWHWMREGFPPAQRYSFSAPIGALCFDPQRPNVVYAGIGRPRWDKEGQGAIYGSEDAGITWERIDGGQLPPDAIVSDIEVKPNNSSVILVATNKGLYRSDDKGKTWRLSSNGLPHSYIEELAFAPSAPDIVYTAIRTTARDEQAWNGGVYRSEDAGQTWQPRNEGLPKRLGKATESPYMTSNYKEIVVDPRNADVVYVGARSWVTPGIYKTTNGGISWDWMTPYDGKRWVNMDYGWITMWGPSVECLAISPVDPDRLLFGTSGHVFLTDDGGKTWQQRYCQVLPDGRFRGNGLEVTCLNDIVPDPVRPNRIYFCYADIGLLISEDAGKTFRRSFKGMKDEGNCFTLLVDPKAPDTIWAATGQWAWNEGYLCRSDDAGESWQVVGNPETGLPNGQIKHIVLDLKSPLGKRRLIITSNGHGFYESQDGGSSWRCINGDLPPEATKRPSGLLLDPANPSHIIVACGGTPEKGAGIYETHTGGTNWQRINDEPLFADIYCLTTDPSDFTTLYVSTREFYNHETKQLYLGGVFKSADGGKTWIRILDYHFVHAVLVSLIHPQVIYAVTADHPYHDNCVAEGVLKSTDGGKTWRKENTNLSHRNITCISISPRKPSVLFVGTGGNSAFIGKDRNP